jgi:pimeloyl-ACP methyl ester carboxylesterase
MGRAGTNKQTTTVHVEGGSGVTLEGDLAIPDRARGIVLFAHGSGSSRRSPRNQFVARVLREAGLGTLLFDLLTLREDAVYETRFDIDLLAQRLAAATNWMTRQPVAASLGVGYFGASTGAAAALIAAAEVGEAIGAVVSRGGRPDLADAALARVTAPTLLIVGGLDDVVIDLNRQAYAGLRCEKRLVIVPGATHLFEEPGTLDEVARLAADWFVRWMGPSQAPPPARA